MLHCFWDMVHDGYNYFSFWAIFCTSTPLTPWKIKILKKMKKPLEISSFYINVPKSMARWWHSSWDMLHDRWMDGQKKWHVEVGAPPKNYKSNGAIINKVKILKTFNCLGLDILALGYSSHFFLIDSENFKLMKHL